MTASANQVRADAGFGLVETMIALAVAAVVAMGIGGLVAFAVQIRDRTNAAQVIERGLASLMAFSSTVERLSAMAIGEVGGEGFVLRRDRDDARELAVRLVDRHLVAAVVPAGRDPAASPEVSRIDLTGFGSSRLEYLSVGAGSEASWILPPHDAAEVRAVRLVLVQAHRSWAVMLWVQPMGPDPAP